MNPKAILQLILPAAVALALGLLLPSAALAADAADGVGPVGPSVSVVKLVLAAVVFLLVMGLGNWMAADAALFPEQRLLWSGLFLAGSLAALAALMLVPAFIVGLLVALAASVGPVVAYVMWRNGRVPEQARAFTPQHLRSMVARLFGREEAEGEIAADRAVHVGAATHLSDAQLLYVDTRDMPIRLTPENEAEAKAFAAAEKILSESLARQAGQMYLVPEGTQMRVRLRMVGTVREAGKLDKALGEAVVTFLKRLAGLDTNEHRKPQTGRFVALLGDDATNVIVQTAGSVKGEHLVASLHPRKLLTMHLADSGMRPEQVERLKAAMGHEGGGVVLMSAPEHSGRTVSMYAALRELDLFARNVVAIEQTISIEVPDVNQVQVDKASGQTLAAAVQDALRSDPDVVMVETVADADTAKMLLTGAAVGKIMVGGLVADDASEAVDTFMKLTGDRQNVAATLLAATGQRLMRTLCPACREAYRPNPEFLRKANLQASQVSVLYREPKQRPVNKKGETAVCPMCRNEGYNDRTVLYEVVRLDEAARRELASGSSVGEIRTLLRKQGQEFLQEEGLRKVVEGTTSVSELLRVLKTGN